MEYVLMNYQYEAAELSVVSGPDIPVLVSEAAVWDEERIPFPVRNKSGVKLMIAMEKWLRSRMIPYGRIGGRELREYAGSDMFKNSLVSCGQSLTDGYWLKKKDSAATWDEISCRKRCFSYDVGNLMFGIKKSPPNLFTPDFTTNGQMPKTWRKREGKTWLLKAGSPPYYEEPFNEKTASDILEKIATVPYVSYHTERIRGVPVSICRNFVEEGFEFVSAWDLIHAGEKPEQMTVKDYLKICCENYSIPGYKNLFDTVTLLDYLINNTDRHFGNFGFLYDVNRKKFSGPAPVFDSGTSFWNSYPNVVPRESMQDMMEEARAVADELFHPERIALPAPGAVEQAVKRGLSGSRLSGERIERIAEVSEARAKAAVQQITHRLEKDRIKAKKKRTEHGICR